MHIFIEAKSCIDVDLQNTQKYLQLNVKTFLEQINKETIMKQ